MSKGQRGFIEKHLPEHGFSGMHLNIFGYYFLHSMSIEFGPRATVNELPTGAIIALGLACRSTMLYPLEHTLVASS